LHPQGHVFAALCVCELMPEEVRAVLFLSMARVGLQALAGDEGAPASGREGSAPGGGGGGGGGGWGLLQSAWSVTQKLAKDVGVNDALKDMKQQVNKIKANQMGGALPLVETVEEVEAAIKYIRESRDKYNQLLGFLQEMALENIKAAPALRRAGGAFIRCASITDKVAREMATTGKDSFYKEMPTYQADLNEALLVTSAALMYQADRGQSMYTTRAHVGASMHSYEQGSYSNKYYTPSTDKLEPGPVDEAIKEVQAMLQNQVMAAERARKKYKDLRLDMSIRALEQEELVKHKRADAETTQAFGRLPRQCFWPLPVPVCCVRSACACGQRRMRSPGATH
jgi:hypothetical protein